MSNSSALQIRRSKFLGQFIGGQWIAESGTPFDSICPSDDSTVWSGAEATSEIVDQAFSAARDAVPAWARRSVDERIEFTEKFAAIIKSSADELAELISAETGKPIWESKTEVGAVIGKTAVSIDSFRKRRDSSSFEMGDLNAVLRFKPFGVMGVLGPFNFPAHLPNGHIIPALIAGNTIVFKPSEQTPAVGQWMVEKWLEAGLPNGVINLVQGSRDVGVAIANHKQLDGLLFTGSSQAGRALHQTFGAHPEKMLALEMGGNNPLIVHQANDLDAAAYTTVVSAYITAGQRCTCARRLIVVQDDQTKPFIEAVCKMIGRLRIGLFTDSPEPFAGTVISSTQGKKLASSFHQLIESGAESIVELESIRGCDALLTPSLVDTTNLTDRGDEELFGPILNLVRVPDFDAAIREANRTRYGLAAGLLSDSRENYEQFIHEIRAGIVNWNRQTTGASGKLPFGGCGLSGNNRSSAYFAADYCSFPVASLESDDLSLPETPMPGIEL